MITGFWVHSGEPRLYFTLGDPGVKLQQRVEVVRQHPCEPRSSAPGISSDGPASSFGGSSARALGTPCTCPDTMYCLRDDQRDALQTFLMDIWLI
jgi:hypothetical protein